MPQCCFLIGVCGRIVINRLWAKLHFLRKHEFQIPAVFSMMLPDVTHLKHASSTLPQRAVLPAEPSDKVSATTLYHSCQMLLSNVLIIHLTEELASLASCYCQQRHTLERSSPQGSRPYGPFPNAICAVNTLSTLLGGICTPGRWRQYHSFSVTCRSVPACLSEQLLSVRTFIWPLLQDAGHFLAGRQDYIAIMCGKMIENLGDLLLAGQPQCCRGYPQGFTCKYL